LSLVAAASRWSGERSFTLFDARVSEDGLVAGYSYPKGLELDRSWGIRRNDL
jgi:hypothetical protein